MKKHSKNNKSIIRIMTLLIAFIMSICNVYAVDVFTDSVWDSDEVGIVEEDSVGDYGYQEEQDPGQLYQESEGLDVFTDSERDTDEVDIIEEDSAGDYESQETQDPGQLYQESENEVQINGSELNSFDDELWDETGNEESSNDVIYSDDENTDHPLLPEEYEKHIYQGFNPLQLTENESFWIFIPSRDGNYRFYTEGSLKTTLRLYNREFEEICFDNNEDNFIISAEGLEAGSEYYLGISCLEEEFEATKISLYIKNENINPCDMHVPADGGLVVVEPTCEEPGYTIYVCTECGDRYADCYMNPNGHQYDGDGFCTICGLAKDPLTGTELNAEEPEIPEENSVVDNVGLEEQDALNNMFDSELTDELRETEERILEDNSSDEEVSTNDNTNSDGETVQEFTDDITNPNKDIEKVVIEDFESSEITEAVGAGTTISGSCSDNIKWTFGSDLTLTRTVYRGQGKLYCRKP